MCMSVPQIAVRCTLMSTSLWPTAGSGTSWSQIPGSARALTSAFMMPLVNDAEIASGRRKCLNDLIELPAGVCSTHLGANSCFSMGNDRKGEGHDIDSLCLNALGEIDSQRCVSQHHRDDGMLARDQIEAQSLHLLSEITRIRAQPLAQVGGALQQAEYLDGGRGHRRCN